MKLFLKERIYDAVVRTHYYLKHRLDGRKYLVLGQRQVGIGNRLIALANMYTWAGKENVSLFWMRDFWVPAAFEELFVMKDAPGFVVSSPERRDWSRRVSLPEMPKGNAEWREIWVPPRWSLALAGGKLFCIFNATPDWARDLYGAFWRQLAPSAEVEKRIAGCDVPPDAIRVMLRNSSERGDTAGVALPERFLQAMAACDPKKRFYVSCMNKEMSELVRGRFGDRVIELSDKNYKSMVDAVADMWILGHGQELICQYGSTFTEAAWWWGGCKSRVTAISQDYVQPF